MIQQYFDKDKSFMDIALNQATKASKVGDFPVGAALVSNGELIAQARNHKDTRVDRISHAEMMLLIEHSSNIKKLKNTDHSNLELHTTFEPCLMCLGTAVIHRIDRIIIACKDPRGDMSKINPQALGSWYENNWPKMDYGLNQSESLTLVKSYFKDKTDNESRRALALLENLHEQ